MDEREKKHPPVHTGGAFCGRSMPRKRLYLHQFVLSGAEADFLGVLEATFPIGIRMDELEEFVGSIGVVMAAAAAIAFATGI